ncbi:MAG: hypothetical protein H6739_08120 [Alphaproteobacteria bacterium]|nr:hypothetical protein [Alphaproteobacteria bacterium]
MRTSLLLALSLTLFGCGKGSDADGDGFYEDQDCDDGDAAAYPGAPELCDDRDNDCDGEVDELPDDGPIWYADADGDGYGSADYALPACTPPAGYIDNSDDCNDLNALSYPGGEEWCDGDDNDCDGTVDESGVDATIWYPDDDGDGYGRQGSVPVQTCDAPEGYADNDDDCDDADGEVNPETYWFADSDGDGYGNPEIYVRSCAQPVPYVDNQDDCFDGDNTVYPGAPEVCDGQDNDCDGAADDADDDVTDVTTWYPDLDADGFGDDASGVVQCNAPTGYIDEGGDCDDTASDINPRALDECDGVDNDCNGVTDNGCPLTIDTAPLDLVGTTSSDYFGYNLEGDGDYDGDGNADLAVGAYGNDTAASGAGAVGLFYGPLGTGSLSDTDAGTVLVGLASSDYFGYALGGPVDANQDGQDDLIIGAYGEDTSGSSAGAAYVFYGPITTSSLLLASDADVIIYGASDSDYVGQYVVDDAGDISGDGGVDLVVGAHGDDAGGSGAGALLFFYGPTSGTYTTDNADAEIIGAATNDYVGYPAAVGYDLDGDGVSDVAYGASGTSSGSGSDEAYLILGPIAGSVDAEDADILFQSPSFANATGCHVEAGDLNGDGNVDLLFGSKYDDDGGASAGAVLMVYGPFSTNVDLASDTDFKVREATSNEFFGANYNMVETGDMDDDGTDDLWVGSYSNSEAATSAGMAALFYGPLSGTIALNQGDRVAFGDSSSDYLGNDGDIADLDGDGLNDLIVGARGWSASKGHVGVWFGSGF